MRAAGTTVDSELALAKAGPSFAMDWPISGSTPKLAKIQRLVPELQWGVALLPALPFRPVHKVMGKTLIHARIYLAAIAEHASAHSLHALAQAWQWSWECLEHSSAQVLHASAQSLQRAAANGLLRAMKAAASRQRSAQSRSRAIQPAIIST